MSTPLLATITTRASNASTSRRVKATTPRPSANAASRALGFGAALGLRAFAHTSGFARGIDAAFGRGARAENGLDDAVDAFMEKGIAGTNIGFALVGEHVFVDTTRPRSTLMAEHLIGVRLCRRALDDDEFLRFEIALHISILGDAV